MALHEVCNTAISDNRLARQGLEQLRSRPPVQWKIRMSNGPGPQRLARWLREDQQAHAQFTSSS